MAWRESAWIVLVATVLLGAMVTPSEAVKKETFRTCAQTGFCMRQREYATNPSTTWSVLPSDRLRLGCAMRLLSFVIEQDEREEEEKEEEEEEEEREKEDEEKEEQEKDKDVDKEKKDKRLQLSVEIAAFEGDIVRMRVDEPERQPPRFRIPEGQVLMRSVSLEEYKGRNKRVKNDQESTMESEDSKEEKMQQTTTIQEENLMLEMMPILPSGLGGISFALENTLLRVEYAPFKVQLIRDGKVRIVFNKHGMFNVESSKTAEEERFHQWTDTQPYGHQSFAADLSFGSATHLYGLPEHAASFALKSTRPIRKAGTTVGTDQGDSKSGQNNSQRDKSSSYDEPYRLYNLDVFEYELDSPAALYGSIPFLMALGDGEEAAGVLWNNAAETWVDIYPEENYEKERVAHFMSEAGVLDLLFFVGGSPAKVLRQYYVATGLPTLPPRFAIAYHQCRWNYNDEKDVLSVQRAFDEHQIPFDVIWLDIEHTDAKKYFTWASNAFPDPINMQRKLVGRQLVVIVDPHIKRESGYPVYDQLMTGDRSLLVTTESATTGISEAGVLIPFEGDCWPGRSVWPDFLNPRTRYWWRSLFKDQPGATERLYIWNDMNEPSVFSGPEVTMPKEVRHLQGTVEHRNVHNLYGQSMHRATYAGLLARSEPARRPFVLTRSFYAGSQRYGAAWTGDNKACWEHLAATTAMLLSLNIAGMPFVGADVGGFFGDPEAELLLRWYQLGALHPFFRAHAHIETKRREPWLIPEPFRTHIRTAIRLRYTLLPYIYTLFQRASLLGEPIIRPLFWEFPGEKGVADIEDHFLLGPSLLVRPITRPSPGRWTVQLPSATRWYDYSTLRMVGEREKRPYEMEVTLSTIPLFIRGGSIICRRDRLRRSSEMMRHDPYTLIIALDQHGQANGHLYDDDGISMAYQDGVYLARRLLFSEDTLRVEPDPVDLQASPSSSLFPSPVERIIVAGMDGERPKNVLLLPSSQSLPFDFDPLGILTIKVAGLLSLNDHSWSLSIS